MARELPRVLVALGAVIATVGVVIYAMGIAYREPRDADVAWGIGLMVGGLVAFVAGLGLYKAGYGGSDEYELEPAQPAYPHQAVHPAGRPAQAARHDEGGDRSRSANRERR